MTNDKFGLFAVIAAFTAGDRFWPNSATQVIS